MSQTVRKGDKIRVHYTGTLNDGSVFDSSVLNKRPPLEFTVGAGQMIAGFDKGVEGMAVGETKNLKLAPEEAYGRRRDDMLVTVEANRMPKGYTPHVGDQLQMGRCPVTVAAVKDDGSVTLDANHSLAGKELNFEVTVVEIL
ncbi:MULTISPECIES: FKBP-type peptidyl-prolyl cis-trans isomerase [unclassified Pyramidobacter]|uniref:FKBP-type peptidyl-prolyl cis-trans isomerase n=1 Tax=unclassified Pyramidobacter TaxID=2632171 RepID=UPI00098F8402|nr:MULTISPECIES: peptidylprolyl isomerase [unclassified Pyramidobacter]MCI7403803.1 peptidylprolyl isomerase [Pyramidobacter sp.]MDY3212076.1 peptidylprolyl isomerase [Pyramidobacter sp.]OON88834.1 peptidylprolyl isomerase [Pyramidobacter sp. C12-8]